MLEIPFRVLFHLPVVTARISGENGKDYRLATYDFDHFADEPVDGLLGFDVIGEMRLEIDGPARLLRMCDE